MIRVGNLDAVRDFTDVRDMVRAYWLAVDKGKPGEVYNIATGKASPSASMLDQLLALSQRGGEGRDRSRRACGPRTSRS